MPAGKTHDRITLWGLPWLIGGSYLLTQNTALILMVTMGYLFAGLMFGPDLDIYSIQYKRWGILRWIWRPYQKLICHRSFLSHGILVGTSLRIIYLLLWIAMLGAIAIAIAVLTGMELERGKLWLQKLWEMRSQYHQTYGMEAIALFVGLEMGAMSHALSDGMGSVYRKLRSPKRPLSTRRR